MLELVKILVPALLLLMPAAVFLRNWKYHDRRKNLHQLVGRGILAVWIVLGLGNGWLVWSQRNDARGLQAQLAQLQGQSSDIVKGKDRLLGQNADLANSLSILRGQNVDLTESVKSLRGQVVTKDGAIQQLQDEISSIRKYSHVAGLTFNGMAYVGGDVTMPTDISPSVEGTWRDVGGNQFRPVCEPDALEKDRRAIQKFPEFPFTYYALAYCLQKQGRREWREYADQAATILQRTTSISGHQGSHDQSLAYLRQLLSGAK